jgi:hypothetical protein
MSPNHSINLYSFVPAVDTNHDRILDFSFWRRTAKGHDEMSLDLVSGLILGAFCNIVRAGPVWRDLGATLGRKTAESRRTLKLQKFEFPILSAIQCKYIGFRWAFISQTPVRVLILDAAAQSAASAAVSGSVCTQTPHNFRFRKGVAT